MKNIKAVVYPIFLLTWILSNISFAANANAGESVKTNIISATTDSTKKPDDFSAAGVCYPGYGKQLLHFGKYFIVFNRTLDHIPTTCIADKELAANIGITKFEKATEHERYDHFVRLYAKIMLGLYIYTDEGSDYHLPGSYWYFDNAKTLNGDGTYEHPFNVINAKTYNSMTNSGLASQNVKMYIARGVTPYDLNRLLVDKRLLLLKDYAIYGRTNDFKLPASDTLRPILNGGVTALGQNNISDIQINSQNFGFGPRGALFLNGTTVQNAIFVDINDVNINVSENNSVASGIGGMHSHAVINNSQINVSSTDQSKQSIGTSFADNSALFIGYNNYIHTTIASTKNGENHSGSIAGISPTIIYGNDNQIIADATVNNSRVIGIFAFGNPVKISGNNNHVIANAAGDDSRAGGIVDIGKTLISGNDNQIIGKAVGLESRALGIGDIEAPKPGTTTPSGSSYIIISGTNNQMVGDSAESNSVGIMNTSTLTISSNNNQIIANSANHVAGHECNAGGIANFGDKLTITGDNNQINVNSADKSYGIVKLSTGTLALNVKNTVFNILSTTTTGSEAAGISLGTLSDISKIIIQNNLFNVSIAGINSKAYGIYLLPNATISVAYSYIALNTFNITNSNDPKNAWGIYTNSNFGEAPAVLVRAHNTWTNPDSSAPLQQVYNSEP